MPCLVTPKIAPKHTLTQTQNAMASRRGVTVSKGAQMNWSAQQYSKFEDERTRPVRDLLSKVPTATARRAADIGCGPGNSTEVLKERFPDAAIVGIDSSEDMLRAARRRLPDLSFEIEDISTWRPAEAQDVILANAALHWVPDHAGLLPKLLSYVEPGGSLAIETPDNQNEPSHVLMRETAQNGAWAAKLADVGHRTKVASPQQYYSLLKPHCTRADVWRTAYHHPLQGIDGVVEWLKGSALRPLLEALSEDEQAEFLRRYSDALAETYSAESDGTVLLPFPRLFIVAAR
jgi:trans-aconitate 2-methyltransferase